MASGDAYTPYRPSDEGIREWGEAAAEFQKWYARYGERFLTEEDKSFLGEMTRFPDGIYTGSQLRQLAREMLKRANEC